MIFQLFSNDFQIRFLQVVFRCADASVPGSRVVVLQGRNFPSFGAGDQGRVIRVDKEALNCEVGAVTDCPGNMSEGGEQIIADCTLEKI